MKVYINKQEIETFKPIMVVFENSPVSYSKDLAETTVIADYNDKNEIIAVEIIPVDLDLN